MEQWLRLTLGEVLGSTRESPSRANNRLPRRKKVHVSVSVWHDDNEAISELVAVKHELCSAVSGENNRVVKAEMRQVIALRHLIWCSNKKSFNHDICSELITLHHPNPHCSCSTSFGLMPIENNFIRALFCRLTSLLCLNWKTKVKISKSLWWLHSTEAIYMVGFHWACFFSFNSCVARFPFNKVIKKPFDPSTSCEKIDFRPKVLTILRFWDRRSREDHWPMLWDWVSLSLVGCESFPGQ